LFLTMLERVSQFSTTCVARGSDAAAMRQ
jgi:hypothetical protein